VRAYEFENFSKAIEQASYYLQYRSNVVHSARWQGADIANRPEMATHEVTHVSFCVNMGAMTVPATPGISVGGDIGVLAEDIKPNLPWADNHFEERVSGAPMNPGTEWANWPYGKSAASFLEDGKFNHNYMERYWPKFAGMVEAPTTDKADWDEKFDLLGWEAMPTTEPRVQPNFGIMYQYGDLNDVIRLLCEDPYTRQAYLPVWFPEDTGGGAKRAPCTIGYHFLMRDGRLDVNYHIRSCDFVRHFRDDLYLTARLLLWVLYKLREIDGRWNDVLPGKFMMQIGSLHIFRNDYLMLFGPKVAKDR